MNKKFTNFTFSVLLIFLFSGLKSQNIIDFSMSPDGVCAPLTVYLTDNSSISFFQGSLNYTWSVDGLVVSTEENPQPIILDKGDHSVSLQVSDDVSQLGESIQNIYVDSHVDTFNIYPGLQVCPGEEVFFEVTQQSYSVEWDFGDNSIFNENTKYNNYTSHVYDNPGFYEVWLMAGNDCGFDTVKQTIEVTNSAIPEVSAFTHGQNQICPNDEIQFDVQGSFQSYLWEFGDGGTSTKKDPIHTYPDQNPNNYLAKVTVYNNCGGSASTNVPVDIIYKGYASAEFNYNSQYNFTEPCPGEKLFFHAYESGIHFWDFGDGSSSDLKNPIHIYALEGNYEVSHTLVNGCGISDTVKKFISTLNHPEILLESVDFMFDMDIYDWEELMGMDTLMICTGELVKFRNETWDDMGVKFTWDFGDGSFNYTRDAQHVFQNPGYFSVTLSATTACGGVTSFSRTVHADAAFKPIVELGVIPTKICPGEEVFFFDNMIDDDLRYSYDIDFGDGNQLNGIHTITDKELFTLAKHAYANAGTFTYKFKAINECGNITEVTGDIIVEDNAINKPFYYVYNSTKNEDYIEPEDWSVRTDPSDHLFNIRVQWPSWNAGYGNKFFIYLWYGGLYIDNDPGMPDGIVEFTTNNINLGVDVPVFVPIDQMAPPSIGLAAGYFCDGLVNYDLEPEVWGAPLDADLKMINEFPLIPAGNTVLTDLATAGIQLPVWDGICNKDIPEGRWYKDMGSGTYAILELMADESRTFFYYNMSYRKGLDEYAESSYLNGGSFYYLGSPYDSLEFEDYSLCMTNAKYELNMSIPDQLELIIKEDDCPKRVDFLSGTFTRLTNKIYNNRSVCPGDLVKFQIAGGSSYLWNFKDGNTSTEQFPVHAYANPGEYIVEVQATNACGRVDNLTTTVTIAEKDPIAPDFGATNRNFYRGDTIFFEYYDHGDREFDNNTYLWQFGDGTSSTEKNPSHVFQTLGIQKVRLTVTNACGSASKVQEYYFEEKQLDCEAKFNYSVEGLTVNFADMSTGEPTNWGWSFGDGGSSNEANPSYNYSREGTYYVTLNTFNNKNQCVSSIVRKIIVGDIDCEADFIFTMNNNTGLGKFTNESSPATQYYWDFGNGRYSTSANPEHTFSAAGIYPVCLTIYNDAKNCQASICKEVIFGASDTVFTKADFSYFVDLTNKTVKFQNLSSPNVTQWYWTFGDGEMMSAQNPEHVYKSFGTYDVCLNVYDNQSGQSHKICKKVIVDGSACVLTAGFDMMIDPETYSVIFKDNTKGEPDKWFWSFGDGITSNQANPRHVYPNPGFYLVTLSVKNSVGGCIDHFAKFIQVGTVDCKADFEYSVNPDMLEVKMNNTSQGPLKYYYWEFGDGRFGVLKNPSHTYKQAGKYPVLLTVIDENELCMDQVYKEIQVGTIDCSADFNTYIDSSSATVYLTNKIGGNSTQLLWTFGDGKYSINQNPVHQYVAPGYFTIGLNTYDMNSGCMDYYEETVLIGSEGIDCKSGFIYQPDPSLSNAIRFKDISKGNIESYLWAFGDGTISTEKDPVHTYEVNGYYMVCLTVENAVGTKNMNCHWVPVFPNEAKNCRTEFYFTTDSASLKVSFADKSIGEPDKYKWEFGDETTSTVKNPSHTYSEKGYYLVKLSTENSTTGCKSKDYKLINVGEAYQLKAAFGYEADSSSNKVSGYPVDFVGTSAGEGATYEWDFGDRKNKSDFIVMDSTSRVVTHYYTDPGIYTACLRITDPVTGQSDTYCQKVRTAGLVSAGPVKLDGIKLLAYPNPLVDYTYIRYSLPDPDFIEMAIFDGLGRRVETLVRTKRDSGEYEILWDTSLQPGGVYYLKLITAKGVITEPLVVNK